MDKQNKDVQGQMNEQTPEITKEDVAEATIEGLDEEDEESTKE